MDKLRLDDALTEYYLDYAKFTIIHRAIPYIDGFKPVQRRIIYTMHNMGLDKPDKATNKSVRVYGEVMGKYHPHGDSSIYGAMANMTSNYEGMNLPLLIGKGSFGKNYSRDLKCASGRYTEVKLNPICLEFFDGIKENAVDFKPNFDNSEVEPYLLPVKFPNILCNNTEGIAVGISCSLPAFPLRNVCDATIGMMNGGIKTPLDLAGVLGQPEFPTGGHLHANQKSLENLCKTGVGSFYISGSVEVYSDKIVVTELPYGATAEDIIDEINDAIQDKRLKGIADVHDEIGLKGFRLSIDLKKGYNSREILRDLCLYTQLRKKKTFKTRVIIGNRCRELSLFELLNEWIKFRMDTVRRVYQYKLDRLEERKHLLEGWEKVIDRLAEVIEMITKNTEEVALKKLINEFGLDEIQAEYFLDQKIKNLTKDKGNKLLDELHGELADKIKLCHAVITDDTVVSKVITEELKYISDKYGKDRKTNIADELTEEQLGKQEVKISDEMATVILTNTGYIKRLTSNTDIFNGYSDRYGNVEACRWEIRNNQHMLVFDRFGTVHKILVDDIDQGRGKPTDLVFEKVGAEKQSDIIYIDACGDYTGSFKIVETNGTGTVVNYVGAKGKRKKYQNLYAELQPKSFMITKADQFFLLTNKEKAAYCNLEYMLNLGKRSRFRIARCSANGEFFCKIIEKDKVPNFEDIDIERFSKEYPVKIGDTILEPLPVNTEEEYEDTEDIDENTDDSEEYGYDADADTEYNSDESDSASEAEKLRKLLGM